MSGIRPELIFVAGPQKGSKTVLMDNSVVAGRGQNCGVVITEHSVSRQQLHFALMPEGWAVENISKNSKVEIDGKKYKAGKKILLETGDVIKVGLETEILFVAPGDDPDAAMAEHGQPGSSAARYAHVPMEVSAVVSSAAEKTATKFKKVKKPKAEKGEKSADNKMKKYLIFGGIYIVAMIVLFAFLIMAKNRKDARGSKMPPHMSAKQVTEALTCDLNYLPSPESSARSLRLAKKYYSARSNVEKNLYLCVKNYRLYLAYRPAAARAFEPTDERQYRIAKSELVDKVMLIYDNAWALQNSGHWSSALREYEALMRYIPPDELPEYYAKGEKYTDATFSNNIQRQMLYVSKKLRK